MEIRAIELAAGLAGEAVIFGVAVAAILVEFYRKKMDDVEKSAHLDERFQAMQIQIDELKAAQSKQVAATVVASTVVPPPAPAKT